MTEPLVEQTRDFTPAEEAELRRWTVTWEDVLHAEHQQEHLDRAGLSEWIGSTDQTGGHVLGVTEECQL